MTKVYLCGAINGCSDADAADWRCWFHSRGLGFYFVDPMSRDYRGRESDDYREIVDIDKRDIIASDIVLVMHKVPSVGSSMEILFAWSHGKPVVVINESADSVSPWLRYHSTAIVASKEAAVAKILEWTA